MIKNALTKLTAPAALLLLLGLVPSCGNCDKCPDKNPPGGINGIVTADVCPADCAANWSTNKFFNVNLKPPTCVVADGKCHADLKSGYQCLAQDTAVLGGKTFTCNTTGAWQ